MYEKVKKQFTHAIEFEDPSAKFNLMWISFNCYYNIKFDNNRLTDRNKIEKLKIDEVLKELFLRLNKDVFFEFIKNRHEENGGVKNLINNDYVKYLCKDCFPEYLEIIYTIRNNQFHGGKDPSSDSDDYKLLKHTATTFENFLKKIYISERIINE